MSVLLVAAGGGAGAVARFVVDGEVSTRWPSRRPRATVLINITGAALLGLLAGLPLGGPWLVLLSAGFCGGYTTFSSAMVESVRVAESDELARSLGVAAVTLIAATGAWVLCYVGARTLAGV